MTFLIANQSTGTQKDLRPWLLPDEAYTDLINAYIYRGRTEKKWGVQKLGPLSRIPESPANVPVVFPVVLPGALVAGATTKIGRAHV